MLASALALSSACGPPGPAAGPKAVGPDEARRWLHEAAEAMGGEGLLRGLKALDVERVGHHYALEQSERPDGPFITGYFSASDQRDLSGRRFRESFRWVEGDFEPYARTRVAAGGTLVVAIEIGGKAFSTKSEPYDGDELALAPERVLLTALGAGDLRAEADVDLQGAPHHVVAFSTAAGPVRLSLNASTRLPTAVETVRSYPYDMYWAPWGDVRTRTLYSYWTLEPNGLHYPRQQDVERNGQPYESSMARKLAFDAPRPEGAFEPPGSGDGAPARPSVAVRAWPLGFSNKPPQEVAPGVVLISGAWNVLLVKQPDGVVVVEAPISSSYSGLVLEDAARRFAGAKVKAVVSTSDAWPHLGGLREYVARGVPAYVLDANLPVVGRLLASPHRLAPDALERAPRRPELLSVARKTVVGEGPNRLELYPYRTESGERMIMAYLPGRRLLYASDLPQERKGGLGPPQYLSELGDAVARERLAVSSFVAMHVGLTPWSAVKAALERRGDGGGLRVRGR